MKIPNLEIYKGLPDSTLFSSRDVVAAFGYGQKTKASNLVTTGLIPKPSKIDRGLYNHPWNRRRKGRLFWKLGDLRKVESELILNKINHKE